MSKFKKKYSNLKFFFVFLFVFVLYIGIKNIKESVFLNQKDRINIVFYGKNVFYLSLSKSGNNYLLKIPVNTKILVPGGYGFYRVGALGKLVDLEKNPDLIKKSFSGATASFVDLYFYSSGKIYYSDNNLDFPDIKSVFLLSSNANLTDRIFLFFNLIFKKKSDFKEIYVKKDIFNQEEFNKLYQGIFYKKLYREKKPTLQIVYKSDYQTAYFLSQIISGEGIRIVDISEAKNFFNNDYGQKVNQHRCLIIYNDDNFDMILLNLNKFFNCYLEKGRTEISDIILFIGKGLYKDWLIETN